MDKDQYICPLQLRPSGPMSKREGISIPQDALLYIS